MRHRPRSFSPPVLACALASCLVLLTSACTSSQDSVVGETGTEAGITVSTTTTEAQEISVDELTANPGISHVVLADVLEQLPARYATDDGSRPSVDNFHIYTPYRLRILEFINGQTWAGDLIVVEGGAVGKDRHNASSPIGLAVGQRAVLALRTASYPANGALQLSAALPVDEADMVFVPDNFVVSASDAPQPAEYKRAGSTRKGVKVKLQKLRDRLKAAKR